MKNVRCKILIAAAFFLAISFSVICVYAEEAPGKWLLGTWVGKHEGMTITSDEARFEFKEDGGVIRWKMDRKGVIRGRSAYWEASGTVTKVDESSVELDGKYDSTNMDDRYARRTGSPLKYSLVRIEDMLKGNALGATNLTIPVTLKKR